MSLLLFFYFFYSFVHSATELELIEVKSEKDIKRFSFNNQETISEEELSQGPLGLMANALEGKSGLIISQNGGPGGRTSFFMRGTEARHLGFVLDGLRINDVSNNDRQLDAAYLSATFLKEVVVHKGPQAVLYGPDNLGGLVELITKKGEGAPQAKLNLGAGSFGTYGLGYSQDWKQNQKSGTLNFNSHHTDGISRLNQKRYDADERDATDITQVSSSSRHHWAQKWDTDLLLMFSRGQAEQDGFGSDNSQDESRNDQYTFQQKTSYSINKLHNLSLRNGFNRYQRQIQTLGNSEFFNGDLYQHEVLHRFESKNWAHLVGLASERESARMIDLSRSFNLHSVFIQTTQDFKPLRFQAGGRVDSHSRYGFFKTGSLGLEWHDFSVQYSQGYKPPTLYQLYGPESFGYPVGNIKLRPEVNHAVELSWKKQREKFDTGISLFQNRLSNLITYSMNQGFLNQGRFVVEGAEFSGKIKLDTIYFFGSFNHSQFKDNEQPVLRRPYNAISGGVSYFPSETMEFNLTGRWFSSRKDLEAKLNPYEVFDFGIVKTMQKNEIAIQIKNMLDRQYEDIYGFGVLPRSIFSSFTHRFL